jgi:membrane-associated protein
MSQVIDFLLHVDVHLLDLVMTYGLGVYVILFLVIFAETGLVVTPFLPGDSLLFAGGALAATGALDVRIIAIVLIAAATLGNWVNYLVGRGLGHRIIHRSQTDPRWGRWVNPLYIARAHQFFEQQGGKAVVLARFVPIVRTFVPFVAGAADMTYSTFAFYNVIGCLLWVGLCVGAGFLFGNIPIIRANFSLVTLGIVAVSLLPLAIEYWRQRNEPASAAPGRDR